MPLDFELKRNRGISEELYRDADEDKKAIQKIDFILYIGLLLIIGIMPLLIRGHVGEFVSPTITDVNIIDTGLKGDVFTYYKFLFLVWLTVAMLALFLYRTFILASPIIKQPVLLLSLVFILIIAASTLVSSYHSISLLGMYNRHDGALTYIASIILFFIAANITYTKKHLYILVYALIPVVLINAIIGLCHFYGINLFDKSFIQKLIIPSSIGMDAVSSSSTLETTINNRNYVSGFAAMMFMMYFTLSLMLKPLFHRIVFSVMTVCSFVLVLTSMSTSGFITIIVALPILLVFIIKMKKILLAIIPAVIILFAIGTSYVTLHEHNSRVWNETFGFFNIPDLLIENTEASQNNSSWGSFTSAIQLGNVVYADEKNEEIKLPVFPKSGSAAGSGRAYIWDRTVALILDRPLLGYGLDTIIYEFPQNEPAKQANLRTMNTIVDKPHNLYIGIAYGVGVIGLIVFLTIAVWHGLASVREFWKRKVTSETVIIAFSLMMAWGSYLVQGMVNDSIIGVFQIFWVIFGVSIALIQQFRLEENKEV